jgi:hypothetical protein
MQSLVLMSNDLMFELIKLNLIALLFPLIYAPSLLPCMSLALLMLILIIGTKQTRSIFHNLTTSDLMIAKVVTMYKIKV